MHVAIEKETMEEKHLILVHSVNKYVLMALSVLDSIISSSDTDDRIVKRYG
jgi:hypothetical protein